MSAYKVFTIAGATGKVGKAVLSELLKVKASYQLELQILTRATGGNAAKDTEQLEKQGVKIIPLDYEDRRSVVQALKGTDVTINCFGAGALQLGELIAKASSIAQVKLFVNSHWGAPMEEYHYGLTHMTIKDEAIAVAQRHNLPWTQFRVGIFPEFAIFFPLLELNLASRKAVVYGTGDEPNSWTTIEDTARFAVHALTHLSPYQLHNRTFNIEADRKTFNEIVQMYIAKHPGEFQVTYKPVQVLEEMVKKSEGKDFFHALMIEYATGAVAHNPKRLDNDDFPGWKPKQVADLL